jgi:hypothetical protein
MITFSPGFKINFRGISHRYAEFERSARQENRSAGYNTLLIYITQASVPRQLYIFSGVTVSNGIVMKKDCLYKKRKAGAKGSRPGTGKPKKILTEECQN